MQENNTKPNSVDIESVSVNDVVDEQTKEKNKPENEQSPNDKIIAELNDKIAELNDKYLRAAAELENTRRRASLDVESVSRNRAMGVAEKILPVMDAVVAALKHNPDDEGIKSMERAIQNAFAQIGIVKINSVGEIMNPQFHNAIQMVDKPAPDTKTNTIVEEMQTGYMFGDTVLRTAMVVVSK
ncbi:MAG: nucleotide exchange factor GrpE [Alphaproteobacteria bacterium]|nr:nucleotide exchange factor GrpE [Alphaproteobacteria bacterium]